jgi:hypothetical protein
MGLRIVEIVPLIGEQHAIRFVRAQLIGQTFSNMLIVVRIGIRQRRHLDQFSAAEPQHVLLFPALCFRNDNQRAVAARTRDNGQADSGITSRGLDHEAARFEFAALFGFEDHPFSGAVLYGLAGIHEFRFAKDGAAG